MPSKTNYFLLLVILFLFASCNQHLYVPIEAHTLTLSNKNDLKASVSGFKYSENKETQLYQTSLQKNYKYLNLQLGYSPIQHLGITASHFQINGMSSKFDILTVPPSTIITGDGKMSSIAIGGYYFLKKDKHSLSQIKSKKGWLFNIYAGFGQGNVNRYVDIIEDYTVHSEIRKFYIQTGIHLRRKRFGLSYLVDVGTLNYYDSSANGKIPQWLYVELSSLSISNVPYVQNNFNFHAKIKFIRLYATYSIFQINKKTGVLNPLDQLIYLGINLDIDNFFHFVKRK